MNHPKAACAYVGCFAFYAGEPDLELVMNKPEGFTIMIPQTAMDSAIYDKCLINPSTADFVSAFEDKEMYLKYGRGMVILKDNEIVSGASSYTRYLQGIEIEVDTIPSERRKHLATAVCAALILECLKEGLYPSYRNESHIHLTSIWLSISFPFPNLQ